MLQDAIIRPNSDRTKEVSIIQDFGVLFLSEDTSSSVMCTHSPQMSEPLYSNLACSRGQGGNIWEILRGAEPQSVFLIDQDFPGYSSMEKVALGVKRLNQIQWADMYILVVALGPSLNITVLKWCRRFVKFDCYIQEFIEADAKPRHWEHYSWSISKVATGQRNIHFLTCHSRVEGSFNLFVKPFSGGTWAGVAISVLAVAVGLKLMEPARLEGGKDKSHNTLHTLTLLYWVLCTLLEQMDGLGKKVERFWAFRVLIGVWVLACTVITNGYRSLVITSLNEPLKLIFPDTFEVRPLGRSKFGRFENYTGVKRLKTLAKLCEYLEPPRIFELMYKPRGNICMHILLRCY